MNHQLLHLDHLDAPTAIPIDFSGQNMQNPTVFPLSPGKNPAATAKCAAQGTAKGLMIVEQGKVVPWVFFEDPWGGYGGMVTMVLETSSLENIKVRQLGSVSITIQEKVPQMFQATEKVEFVMLKS